MAVAKRQIKSWLQLCDYAAEQMESAYFTDWPLYTDDEEIGADSTGGTEHKVYANIMRHGVLTVDSQEGTCEPMAPLTSIDDLRIPGKIFVAASEKQRSYVDALVPTDIGKQILEAFFENGFDQQYYYLWVNHDQGMQTSVPKTRFNVTSVTWRDERGKETEDLITNTNVLHTREALEDSVASLIKWIRPQDRQSFNRDLEGKRIGYLSLVDRDYCSGRESAGRLLLKLLDTLQGKEQPASHVRDPRTGRCILVGGPTWRQMRSKYGDEVNLYQRC